MFNLKTLLSVFNEKGTLLKWLQNVEKALKGDTLQGVSVSQPTATTAIFTFLFGDNTSLESDTLNLPAGAPGENGAPGAPGKDGSTITSITTQGSREIDGYTETEIDVNTNDSATPKTFTVSAKNGADGAPGAPGANGADGNGIVSVTTIGYTPGTGEYEGYTETTLNVDTDEETIPIKVYAKNGADGAPGGVSEEEFNTFKENVETSIDTLNNKTDLYYHAISLYFSNNDGLQTARLYFSLISTQSTKYNVVTLPNNHEFIICHGIVSDDSNIYYAGKMYLTPMGGCSIEVFNNEDLQNSQYQDFDAMDNLSVDDDVMKIV